MKDLFFKDLSYKVLSKFCGKKRRTHILFIPTPGLSDQRFTQQQKRKEGVRL